MRQVKLDNHDYVWVDADVKEDLVNKLNELSQTDARFSFYFEGFKYPRFTGYVRKAENWFSNRNIIFMLQGNKANVEYRWQPIMFIDQITKIEHSAKGKGGIVYEAKNDNSLPIGHKVGYKNI